MKKDSVIVITGSNGFIGNHLAKRLKSDGFKFRFFDKKIHDFRKPETLVELFKKAEIVFHLAGIISQEAEELELNKISTQTLIEVAPKARIIFASSFAVYQQNNYGLSKLACEKLLQEASKAQKVDAISLRLSNVYGPQMLPFKHSVIATFIEQIQKNEMITINNGSQKRDFIYIEDVIDALIKAANISEITTPVVDICSNELISINALVELIQKIMNKKAKIKFQQIEGQELKVSPSNLLAKKILGWTTKVSLEQGLIFTCNSSKYH